LIRSIVVVFIFIAVFLVAYGRASAEDAPCVPGTWEPVFLLRNDFSNFGTLNCSEKPKDYNRGAIFSFKYDNIARDPSIAIDGVAAGVMRFYGNSSSLIFLQVGPYIQGDGTFQFQSQTAPSKAIDTITAGAFIEFGFPGNYFRIRGGGINGTAGVESTSLVGEWIPVFYPIPGLLSIGAPSQPTGWLFGYELDPELIVQYDELNSGPHSYLIFQSGDDRVLRVGPQVLLKVYALDELINRTSGALNQLLSKSFVSLTVHESNDTFSGRNFIWTTLSFNYELQPHFGITASYGHGNIDTTGNKTDQFKAGLAVKF
jgi:hypothetical protein